MYVLNGVLQFQSTLPVRGVTYLLQKQGMSLIISIHTPREGSDPRKPKPISRKPISIHTPREGSDVKMRVDDLKPVISIHTPREGSDFTEISQSLETMLFQSTLPVRGVTQSAHFLSITVLFQSTLPVWGVTTTASTATRRRLISIHTPRVGSDGRLHKKQLRLRNFNPHSPCGE